MSRIQQLNHFYAKTFSSLYYYTRWPMSCFSHSWDAHLYENGDVDSGRLLSLRVEPIESAEESEQSEEDLQLTGYLHTVYYVARCAWLGVACCHFACCMLPQTLCFVLGASAALLIAASTVVTYPAAAIVDLLECRRNRSDQGHSYSLVPSIA